ncbi:MAG: PilZ domain-containing protein [Candidatus Omnitrophota bacterium]
MTDNRRNYIRLNSVFPVEYQFIDTKTSGSISDIMQAYTKNISKGGMCLEANTTDLEFEALLKRKDLTLDIRFNIPLDHKKTKATGDIIWYKKIESGYPAKYLIGLSFKDMEKSEIDRIYFHALRTYLTPRIVKGLVAVLVIGLLYFYVTDFRLKRENRLLAQNLVELSSKKSGFEKNILDIDDEHNELEEKLQENEKMLMEYKDRIKNLESETETLRKKENTFTQVEREDKKFEKKFKEELEIALSEKEGLNKEVSLLLGEITVLKDQIEGLSDKRVVVEEALSDMLPSFEIVESKSMDSMYRWLKNHQDRISGLVVSYEGDKGLEDWAFTYDESLAAQCFTLMGEKERAEKIFEFYSKKAKRVRGAFINAYDAYSGLPLEYNVHTGPNVWLGIAILQYIDKFEDKSYLGMAKGIGDWLIALQEEDEEFGIRGGPNFQWFSTEHNLDAYAFFGLLYNITKDKAYLKAQDRSLTWIMKNAYDHKEGRMNRGKGDATIATDTFAWAIAAIGPEVLKEKGMDPDQIISFAEENCLVATDFARPNKEIITVTGFDFGKHTNIARGGMISTEWTAQMIVSMKIMARYHDEKGNTERSIMYKRKADFYLSELEKMMIISSSKIGQGEGCLPYASQDDVDTGHGWRVPKGSRTGSTAGTSYTIFAKNDYNPLSIE